MVSGLVFGIQQNGFLSASNVLCEEAGAMVHIVTQWSGSGGTETCISGQLVSFSALTLLVGSSDL